MFIETEATPNPETLKFLPDQPVMSEGSAYFEQGADVSSAPIAEALLALDGVAAVFLGLDYISVTKIPTIDWQDLKPHVLGAMMRFLTSGAPLFVGDLDGVLDGALAVEEREEDRAIADQIRTLLDDKIRPGVAGDGGDIVYRGFQDGIVYLEMQGACSGCPSSTITLKHGIENLLKYYVPEVSEVRQV